jgi:MoxR-like ATPase
LTFSPQRPQRQHAKPANLKGAAVVLALGLVVLVLPAFAPKPQGSPAFIVALLVSWFVGGPLVLVGLWGVGKALWQRRGAPPPPE